MGNVRSGTGTSATETRTGRAGGRQRRSCPVPAYTTCRSIAEARGFLSPLPQPRPQLPPNASKGRSPLAPTPLGGGGRRGAPGRAPAAFVLPAGPRRARVRQRPPSPPARSRSPSCARAQSRPRRRLPAGSASPARARLPSDALVHPRTFPISWLINY
ncbi:uncharacterized protein RBU47_000423 isoform 1-T1 [Passerculus sandwichensis]